MEDNIVVKDLKVKTSYRQILSIALPITVAILIPQINMLTNNIFLGHFDKKSLGDAGVTAVFYLIFAVAGHGLNNGLQSIFSKHAGADNSDKFKVILTEGIRISIIVATVGILFTYFVAPIILKSVADELAYPAEMSFLKLRILGLPFLYLFQMGNAFLVASLNSRLLMIGFAIEACTNILLDYLFIFGHWGFPQMGFNGAALASVLAECIGMVAVFTVIYLSGLKKQYNLLQTTQFDKIVHNAIVKVSTPLVLQYVISVTTWLVFFFFIEALHDADAKAISNTMRNVFGIGGVFVWAFASTSNVMVSNLMGQKRPHEVIGVLKKISLLSFSCCALMMLLVNCFPSIFFGLFGQSQEFVSLGLPVLQMVTFGLLAMSIANIWLNAVTGTGKTKVNLFIELIAITLYLVYTIVFTKWHYVSLPMAWSNEIVYWSSIFLMAFIFFKKGNWRNIDS